MLLPSRVGFKLRDVDIFDTIVRYPWCINFSDRLNYFLPPRALCSCARLVHNSNADVTSLFYQFNCEQNLFICNSTVRSLAPPLRALFHLLFCLALTEEENPSLLYCRTCKFLTKLILCKVYIAGSAKILRINWIHD